MKNITAIYGSTYKDLEKEIEELKEKRKYDLCFINHLKEDKKELQQRIDKAIEYIKNNTLYYENYDYNTEDELELKYVYDDKARKDLLEILGGE